jgi:hydroxyacylglutathione hydrolase
MKLQVLQNDLFAENTYFLIGDKSVLLVDPGSNVEQIVSTLDDIALPLEAILLTHTHYDHIIGVNDVRHAFPETPLFVGAQEETWLTDPLLNLSGQPHNDHIPNVVVQGAANLFAIDEPYQLGEFKFRVLYTPGHSIGGVSFVFDDLGIVFTGDALFNGGIGRYDLNTGNAEMLLESIRNQLFTLPGHFQVLPGHGPASTIGHERNFNPYF